MNQITIGHAYTDPDTKALTTVLSLVCNNHVKAVGMDYKLHETWVEFKVNIGSFWGGYQAVTIDAINKSDVMLIAYVIDMAKEFNAENFNLNASLASIKKEFPKSKIIFYGINYEAYISEKMSKENIRSQLVEKLPKDASVFLGECMQGTQLKPVLLNTDYFINLASIRYCKNTVAIATKLALEDICERSKKYRHHQKTLVDALLHFCSLERNKPRDSEEIYSSRDFLICSTNKLLETLDDVDLSIASKQSAIVSFYDSNRRQGNFNYFAENSYLKMAFNILASSLSLMAVFSVGGYAAAGIGGVGGLIAAMCLMILTVTVLYNAANYLGEYLNRARFFNTPKGKLVDTITKEANAFIDEDKTKSDLDFSDLIFMST